MPESDKMLWWSGLADMPPDDASALHALSLGFMAARALQVALEFRLFTHLAETPLALAPLAQKLGLSERASDRLLTACAALGLVRWHHAQWHNTPLAQKYLVEDKPTFIGSYLQMFDALGYQRWAQMGTALQQDAPLDEIQHPYHYLAEHAEDAASFSAAQHSGSRSLGHLLARQIDFAPFRCLLDLGGGSGAYTIEILQRYGHLQAILMDFPAVCRLAEDAIQQAALGKRVRTVPGDYERDPLPEGFDIVLWSGNMHASSPSTCLEVLHKLRALLPAHGLLLIHDYLIGEQRTGPLIPALLGLHLTLVSTSGQVYHAPEIRQLLHQSGFPTVHIQPFLPHHSSLILAYPQERAMAIESEIHATS